MISSLDTGRLADINIEMIVTVFVKTGLPKDDFEVTKKSITRERNLFENELKKVELTQGIIPCIDFSRQKKSPNVKEFISRAVSIFKKAGLDPTKY